MSFALSAAIGLLVLSTPDVRVQMESVIAELDSAPSVKSASAPEQVVLTFETATGRTPTPEEFHTLLGLQSELNLKPSDLLALALRGREPELTWDACSQFLARKNAAPAPSPQTRAAARALLQTTPQLPPEPAPQKQPAPPAKAEPGIEYNTWFGYLHAHSALSDGTGSPEEAYAAARAAGLDFFALTDHGELLRLWPWQDKWEQEKAAADAADAPGQFAALWGFEWSSPLYGHVTIVNTDDYTDCLSSFRLFEMYDWLAMRPEAFGRFNHPGYYGYAIADLMHFQLYPAAAAQMVGVELWNDKDGFDRYYYNGNWSGPESYLDAANLNGWRISPLGGEDNHRGDWGRMGQFRTAVLATELTRDAIADAYRARRFYATEDGNLCLDFRCNGYPMGSSLDGGQRVFNVTAYDRDGEQFEEVRLYRNGELIETRPVEGGEVSETFTDDSTKAAYYYVIVKQRDDSDANGRNDEAISAPIWFGTIDGQKSGCYAANAENNATANLNDLALLILAAAILAVAQASRLHVFPNRQ